MSTESNSHASPNASGHVIAHSNPRVPHSSEEEAFEDSSSGNENNSLGSNGEAQSRNTESRSWNLLRQERQPSPTGPLPDAPMTDPYLQGVPNNYHVTARFIPINPSGEGTSRANAGPSNVHDYYSWESFMRREFGIEDPNVVAGVPVERTAGMSMDEFRQLQAITASLTRTRERVTQQAQALDGAYFHAEAARMVAAEGRDMIWTLIWILLAFIVLIVALLITILYRM